MIKESYLASREWRNTDRHKEFVTRTAKSVLAPSQELLDDWKNKKITWVEYERRFRIEMQNPKAIKRLQELKEIAKQKDVWLICYEKNPPCHRFILIDMLKQSIP